MAGKAGESLLIQAVTGAEGVTKMPPKGPGLSAEQIELLKRWIDEGAAVPTDRRALAARPARATTGRFNRSVIRSLPQVEAIPPGRRNPIDAFVLARLDAAGLRPSPEADQATLIRRG